MGGGARSGGRGRWGGLLLRPEADDNERLPEGRADRCRSGGSPSSRPDTRIKWALLREERKARSLCKARPSRDA